MAWVPIVIPPSGVGLLRPQRLPDHLRSAYAYYRRCDPRTGHRYEFKWYYDQAQDITGKMNKDGFDYYIYAIEVEVGEREIVEYDETAKNQIRVTGKLF